MVDNIAKRQIAEQWRGFMKAGSAEPSLVRDFILASWQRSRDFHVDPENVEAKMVAPQRFAAIRSEHQHLMRISLV